MQVSDSVQAGTADFAESRSGAAVLAWDARTVDAQSPGGRTDLMVALRPSAGAEWSAPSVLASDADLDHRASVGLSTAGVATVAYAHDSGQGVGVDTRQYSSGVWAPAVEHAVAPVRQIELAVGATGYATIAWSQEDVTGQVDLYVRRYVPSVPQWQDPFLIAPGIAPRGLLDLNVNSTSSTVLDFYSPGLRGGYEVRMGRNVPDNTNPLCAPDCSNMWTSSTIVTTEGTRTPSTASTVTSTGYQTSIHPWHVGDGTDLIQALELEGGGHGLPATISGPGDYDHITAVSDGFRTFATWVSHTPSGDELYARTVASPNYDVVADPETTYLGVASGAAVSAIAPPAGDAVVVWADTTVQPAVLRSVTVHAFSPLFQEPDQGVMISPRADFTRSVRVPVRWRVSGGAADGARYDVRTRQANARHRFGSRVTWKKRTARTSARLHAVRGRTICFSTRAHTTAGAITRWSAERCTAVALDDTALTARGWHRQRDARFYGRSRLATATKGARLRITRVRARSVALLVSRRHGNGRVRVRLGGTSLGTVRLAGAHAHRVVLPVAKFARVRRGTLTITAVDAHKRVNVDGVFISAR